MHDTDRYILQRRGGGRRPQLLFDVPGTHRGVLLRAMLQLEIADEHIGQRRTQNGKSSYGVTKERNQGSRLSHSRCQLPRRDNGIRRD